MAVGTPIARRANVTVRPGRPEDAVAIAELLLPLEPQVPSLSPGTRSGRGARGERPLPLETAAEHLRARLADPELHLFVATDLTVEGDPVVGVAVSRFDDAGLIAPTPVLAVTRLAVAPRVRRRGIGRALLKACIELAEGAGVQYLQSASQPSARDANRYLARVGFAAVATRRMAPVPTVRRALGLPALGLVVAGTDPRLARRRARRVLGASATTVTDVAHPGA